MSKKDNNPAKHYKIKFKGTYPWIKKKLILTMQQKTTLDSSSTTTQPNKQSYLKSENK